MDDPLWGDGAHSGDIARLGDCLAALNCVFGRAAEPAAQAYVLAAMSRVMDVPEDVGLDPDEIVARARASLARWQCAGSQRCCPGS